MQPKLTPTQRFWNKVDPCRTDGCALWLGAITTYGYGQFTFDGGWAAHHFLVGRPPAGMVWDHVATRGCTHRNCVWPGHLELVTRGENNKRAWASRTPEQRLTKRSRLTHSWRN